MKRRSEPTPASVGGCIRALLVRRRFDGRRGSLLWTVRVRGMFGLVELNRIEGAEVTETAIAQLCTALYSALSANDLSKVPIYVEHAKLPITLDEYLTARAAGPVLPIDGVTLGWATADEWEVACRLAEDHQEWAGRPPEGTVWELTRLLLYGVPPGPGHP